jgi:hypothetical protein
MRFDRRSRPNPYVTRSDQFRLLRLVGLIALVMVLIQVAARPSSWNWFAALSDPQAAQQPGDDFGGPLTPLDIKRPEAAAPLPGDTFYGRVAETETASADAAEVALPEPSPEAAPATADADQLPAEMFTGVEDDWLGATRAEQPALVRVARHIDAQGAAALEAIASREATFDSLVGRPEYFRGRPVQLAGRLRRCTQGRIGVGDEARDVWEAWVIAHDSHATPYLVYALDVPNGMPTGESLDEAVQFSGFVVRRFAYASMGGEAVTTMLIAPTLRWTPATPPVPERLTQEMQWSTFIGISILVGVLSLVGGWYLLSDRKFRRGRMHAIGESRLDADPADLQQLSQLDGGDPHQIRIREEAEQPAAR